jgi:hypothetical protein
VSGKERTDQNLNSETVFASYTGIANKTTAHQHDDGFRYISPEAAHDQVAMPGLRN